ESSLSIWEASVLRARASLPFIVLVMVTSPSLAVCRWCSTGRGVCMPPARDVVGVESRPSSLVLPARPTRLRDPRLRLGLAVDGPQAVAVVAPGGVGGVPGVVAGGVAPVRPVAVAAGAAIPVPGHVPVEGPHRVGGMGGRVAGQAAQGGAQGLADDAAQRLGD